METKFQTSFIPRKPLVASSSAAPTQHSGDGPGGLMVFIGLVAMGLSVASAIAVFGWEKVENKKIEENKITLEKNRKEFGSDVEVLKKFNDRINLTKQLIDNHTSVSNIFTLIADSTVDKVRFTSFEFKLPENPMRDKIKVTLKGEASSFASLAYQTDVFASNSPIKESSVSDLSVGEKGNINFSFNAVIPADQVSYRKQFNTENTGLSPAQPVPENPSVGGLLEETPFQGNE